MFGEGSNVWIDRGRSRSCMRAASKGQLKHTQNQRTQKIKQKHKTQIDRSSGSMFLDRSIENPRRTSIPSSKVKRKRSSRWKLPAGDAAVAGMHWGWLPASVQLNRTPVEAGAACPHPPNCRERPRPNCARPIDPSTRASIEEGMIEAADRSVGCYRSRSLHHEFGFIGAGRRPCVLLGTAAATPTIERGDATPNTGTLTLGRRGNVDRGWQAVWRLWRPSRHLHGRVGMSITMGALARDSFEAPLVARRRRMLLLTADSR